VRPRCGFSSPGERCTVRRCTWTLGEADSLSATLSGRNLADRDYYRIGLVLISPSGIRFARPPRPWMFDVRYTF
jgi:hypothetical protein